MGVDACLGITRVIQYRREENEQDCIDLKRTETAEPGTVKGASARRFKVAIDYKSAGVDVEAGDALVDWLQNSDDASAPHADKVLSGIGGFAAIFRLQFPEIKKPALVACTDGVGTKVKLAAQFARFQSLGQDLVAMCVNDLVCCGARPLFFLDYYAVAKLETEPAQQFLQGVRQACHESGCALIGGETAEMPGVYRHPDFDCAGFAVGLVDEDRILGPDRVAEGAELIGISSSGFHSNGYSLLRELLAEELEAWQDRLMRPTHLYAKFVHQVLGQQKNYGRDVQAIAHITGGGMENIPRVLPPGTRVRLLDWTWPDEFIEIQDRSGLSRVEMLKTFNCGVGLVFVVAPEFSDRVQQLCLEAGFRSYHLGTVEASDTLHEEPHIIY